MPGPDQSPEDLHSAETAVVSSDGPQPAPAPARLAPGQRLAGRYRIVAPLGKGGMGEVYRADDLRLGQPVALKFLPAAFASDVARLERLVDEVRIGRQISHPNVCRLYDIAEADGHHFLVMEYVDGEDLASLLRRIGRLPGDTALGIARGFCAGLAAAHDKGVVHCDLKPANVMVDGRGHARIADFGLAALATGGPARGLAGTLAYMAPEQLTGAGVSPRSDVFALGLVLYEMLTGQRVFQATSPAELRALHDTATPTSLPSSLKDVDPALRDVVERCLSRDPATRPASAREVLALLPGGDPLQAAVRAGETPSPEMVAAAAKIGDLRTAVAWTSLAAGLLGLLATAFLTGRVAVFGHVPLEKSPEVLAAQAKEVLAELGYARPPVGSAQGFAFDYEQLAHIQREDRSPARWRTLRAARPGVLQFFYRGSPEPLVQHGWIVVVPWTAPPDLGRITRETPPLDVPGMTLVALDTQGRLVRFTAVPPRLTGDGDPAAAEPDWAALLELAGFPPGELRTVEPRWTPPVAFDTRTAWETLAVDPQGRPLRLEAAAFRGRVVHFELLGPWVRPPSGAGEEAVSLRAATALTLAVFVMLVLGVVFLVRRNLRLGRGDRRGALRLALVVAAAVAFALIARADHTSRALDEYTLLVIIVALACYSAVLTWGTYMALEPALRRRWPHLLISWNRLLEGRLRDPLVARDVLVGVLLALAYVVSAQLAMLAPAWLGGPPVVGTAVLTTLSSPWQLAYYAALVPALGIVYGVAMLFLFYLMYAAVRREHVARLLLFAFLFVPTYAVSGDPRVGILSATIFTTLAVVGLTRFGLLTSAVLFSTFLLLMRTPLTLDWSAWYAGRSFAVLLGFAALLTASAYLSLGGKPVFGRALLDD